MVNRKKTRRRETIQWPTDKNMKERNHTMANRKKTRRRETIQWSTEKKTTLRETIQWSTEKKPHTLRETIQ